jgi:hypothetical protein
MGLKIGLHIKNSRLKRQRIDWRIVSRKKKDDSQLQIGKIADKNKTYITRFACTVKLGCNEQLGTGHFCFI